MRERIEQNENIHGRAATVNIAAVDSGSASCLSVSLTKTSHSATRADAHGVLAGWPDRPTGRNVMVELSSRASCEFEPSEFEPEQWSQGQTFVFVVASSVVLWTLIGLAIFAVL